jgi:L-lactate dehydrogenase
LSEHLQIDARHIHAFVVGEHGDSEVLTWSLSTAAGMPLEAFAKLRGVELHAEARKGIENQVRGAAYRIIQGKGASYYGVGAAIVTILDAVLNDRQAVLTVCRRMPEAANVRDVTLSLPMLVGGTGVTDVFVPPLSASEQEELHRSATVIREALDGLGLGRGSLR